MQGESSLSATLIAPCGMNCALCHGYQRYKNRCGGCRSDNIASEYCRRCVIKNCEKLRLNGWDDCSLCIKHCARLKALDKRYRTKYGMSMIDNLSQIRDNGIEAFLAAQREK